jgi:MYXO-CTERM domain-containing protein
MKLSQWTAVLGIVAVSFVVPACDGDDPATDSVEQNTDDDATDDDATDDDATDDDAGGQGPVEPSTVPCPTDAADLSEAFAEAVCTKRGECCSDDYEVCISEVTEALDAIYVDIEDAIDGDTASLDCASFTLCSDAILSADCSEWPLQVGDLAEIPVDEPACRQMVTPRLSTDEECSWNYECQDGFCHAEDGLCHAFARENELCEDTLCHLPTMFCNAAGVCQQRLDNGVSCTDAAECQSRVCDLEGSGTCVAPGPDACEYVPSAPAQCSTRRPGGGSTAFGVAVFLLAVAAGRRRRRPWRSGA